MTNIETKVYDLEYFSGAQMNMYIGDVLIDEVTSLAVSVRQNKMPVWGYASQLFDKVARGTVLVQGTFTINFKESGYLYAVLQRYKSMSLAVSGPSIGPAVTTDSFIDRRKLGIKDRDLIGGAKLGGKQAVLRRQNIEQIGAAVDAITNGSSGGTTIRKEDEMEYFRQLSGFNNGALPRAGSVAGALNPAEDVFEAFEDKIWGGSDLDQDSEGRRGDSNKWDDFTIFVSFGDYNRNNNVNHTAKRIDRVHLIDQAQTIMINGEPVAEQYSFIARNFV
jgi:hypothetical protein